MPAGRAGNTPRGRQAARNRPCHGFGLDRKELVVATEWGGRKEMPCTDGKSASSKSEARPPASSPLMFCRASLFLARRIKLWGVDDLRCRRGSFQVSVVPSALSRPPRARQSFWGGILRRAIWHLPLPAYRGRPSANQSANSLLGALLQHEQLLSPYSVWADRPSSAALRLRQSN